MQLMLGSAQLLTGDPVSRTLLPDILVGGSIPRLWPLKKPQLTQECPESAGRRSQRSHATSMNADSTSTKGVIEEGLINVIEAMLEWIPFSVPRLVTGMQTKFF